MKNRSITYLLFALVMAAAPQLLAQGSKTVVKATGHISTTAIRPGDKFKVAVVLDVAEGYHVNAHVPTFPYLIATKAELTAPANLRFGELSYPVPDNKSFAWAPDTKLDVYEGAVVIVGGAEADSTIPLGMPTISARVTVQACNDAGCLLPDTLPVEIPITVVSAGTEVQQANADLFSGLKQFQGGSSQKDDLGELIASSGLPLALLTVFFAGLALNLTPCVYPIIPITISFFMNQAASQGKPRLSRTFLMAVTYVFGMAITYSILGVVASMTGGLFGAALQSPIVLIGIAGVMVALALSMFGLYEFRTPEFLNRFATRSTQSTGGVIGALMMGLTMGIVAAPCIGPFVLGLLVHVSAKGEPIYGFFIFFVLALGLGLPYMLLGTFSGAIKSLPRSGQWMISVRKVFGVVLIGMALYFLMPLMGAYTNYFLVAFFGSAALYFLLWESGRATSRNFAWILRAIGIGAAVVAITLAVPRKIEAEIPWQPYSEQLLAAAQQDGRPVVIDVFADWCLPCKELDKITFTDAKVKTEAERFVTLKLDLTTSDPETEAGRAKNRYRIVGVPTVIFLDTTGRENETLRLTGFEKPDTFLTRLKNVPSLPAGDADTESP